MSMVNAFDADRATELAEDERRLLERRARALGPAYRLFYEHPVHVVRGEGVWLFDANGRRYLDAYNNVASVGHAHPRVVEAIATQAAQLNTHTRYLHELIVTYAERLLATLTADTLGNVMFTCTGSEANDLALRIAQVETGGQGVIVTANAYHGVTSLLAGMSPSLGAGAPLAPFVRAIAPPRPGEPDASGAFATRVADAADDLAKNGYGAPVLLIDSVLSSDGVLGTSPGILRAAADAIHAAGGLVIADEVQSGLGRIGDAFWGFRFHEFAPDIVTCGKPLGNGYPIGMVACRSDLAAAFGTRVRYFNTFGGSAVAAAAGLAVLDVIAEEKLANNAEETGAMLVDLLDALRIRDNRILRVRGAGLSIGVDVRDATSATTIVNGLRERGVLISATGPHGDVLKIRPPLPFARAQAELFAQTLEAVLTSTRQ